MNRINAQEGRSCSVIMGNIAKRQTEENVTLIFKVNSVLMPELCISLHFLCCDRVRLAPTVLCKYWYWGRKPDDVHSKCRHGEHGGGVYGGGASVRRQNWAERLEGSVAGLFKFKRGIMAQDKKRKKEKRSPIWTWLLFSAGWLTALVIWNVNRMTNLCDCETSFLRLPSPHQKYTNPHVTSQPITRCQAFKSKKNETGIGRTIGKLVRMRFSWGLFLCWAFSSGHSRFEWNQK